MMEAWPASRFPSRRPISSFFEFALDSALAGLELFQMLDHEVFDVVH
jgi:hypothetical protein